MKRLTKTALRLMIVVGLICYGTSTLSASAIVEKRIEEIVLDRVDKQLSISDSTSISIDVSFSDVYIGPSSDDTVHITYTNTNRRTYEIEQNNDKLQLNQVNQVNNWENVNWETLDVIVLIPSQFNGDLSIENEYGSIDIDPISAKSFDVYTGYGDIRLEKISSQSDIILDTEYGDIELEEISSHGDIMLDTEYGYIDLYDVNLTNASSIEADTDYGDITLEAISLQGNVTLDTEYGDIDLRDVNVTNASTIDANTNYGTIDLYAVFANSIDIISGYGRINAEQIICTDIRIETNSRDIEFSELDAQKITIDSSDDGDIRGNIVGNESDFSVTSRTSGRNNLPEAWGSGSKTLDIYTGSGDIDVSFTE